jgi:hypothetical protein
LAWFVIEKYINLYWDAFLDKNALTLKKDRIRRLSSDDRTYSAAVKTEILQFNGFLPTEEYDKISRVRSIRNNIVHITKNKKCSAENCCEAYQVIAWFVKKDINIHLELNTGYILNGI